MVGIVAAKLLTGLGGAGGSDAGGASNSSGFDWRPSECISSGHKGIRPRRPSSRSLLVFCRPHHSRWNTGVAL